MDRLDTPEGFTNLKDAYLKQLSDVEFTILVWGSGERNKDHYEKRCLIRDHLATMFRHVLMSEDIFQEDVAEYGLWSAYTVKTILLLQLR